MRTLLERVHFNCSGETGEEGLHVGCRERAGAELVTPVVGGTNAQTAILLDGAHLLSSLF